MRLYTETMQLCMNVCYVRMYILWLLCRCTIHAGSILYVYGGWDGQKAHNTLHQLNLQTYAWSEVKVENLEDAPSEMSGCGLVAYGKRKLVLFGGYGMINEKKKPAKECTLATVEEEDGGNDASTVAGEEKNKNSTTLEVANNGVNSQCSNGATTVTTSEEGEKEMGKEEGEAAREKNGFGERGGDGNDTVGASGKGERDGAVGGGGDGEKGDGGERDGAVGGGGDGEKGDGGEDEKVKDDKKKAKNGEEQVKVNGETEVESPTTQESNSANSSHESENDARKKAFVIKPAVSFALDAPQATKGPADVQITDVATILYTNDANENEGRDESEENTTFLIYKRNEADPKGWTNEVKVFDLDTGEYNSHLC